MASLSGTFTATNQASLSLYLRAGEIVRTTLTITGSATVRLYQDIGPGVALRLLETYSATTSGTDYKNITREVMYVRLVVTAISGSVAYTLADVQGDQVLEEWFEGSGRRVAYISDEGFVGPVLTPASQGGETNVFDYMTPEQIADATAGTALTDHTAALQSAITAVGVTGARLVVPTGVYLISQPLTVTQYLRSDWRDSTLRASAGFVGSELMLLNCIPFYGEGIIENLILDFSGDNTIDGIKVTALNQFTFRRVRPVVEAAGGRYMFHVDGTSAITILDLLWDSCRSFRQEVGWYILGMDAPQTTSFDDFTLLNCQVESETGNAASICVYAKGAMGNRLTLIGGAYQNAGDACLVIDGFFVENGAYVEPQVTGLYGRGLNGAHIHHTAGAHCLMDPVYWTTDGTVTHKVDNKQIPGHNSRTPALAGPTDGARSFVASAAWRDSWGPPNYPTTKAGSGGAVGMRWTDMQGTVWTCTQAGITNATPDQRWCALGGTIVIPVDYVQLTNGRRLLNVQGDFEVESIELYVTTSFSGGTNYSFGDTAAGSLAGKFLSPTQCAAANLVAGATIRSIDNKLATAALNTPTGRHRIVGKEYDETDDSNINCLVSGTFVAGAGLLIVKGRYLTSPATGLPTFGIASAIAVPAYETLKVAHFDFVEDAASLTHTATLVLPANSQIHDIQVDQRALWAAAAAVLKVGDTADDDGYFTGVDLKATDLLVGEQLRLVAAENWGGKQGAYLDAATGRRGPTSNNFGGWYVTGSSLTAIVTVTTPSGSPTGRTRVTVTYSLNGSHTVALA